MLNHGLLKHSPWFRILWGVKFTVKPWFISQKQINNRWNKPCLQRKKTVAKYY